MALTDYVIMPGSDYQALCDKIREKTGKTGVIKSGDLVTEVEEVAGSGGASAPGEYFVKVIDYDGTVLSEKYLNNGDVFVLPMPPSHDRLVFEGWSSSADIVNGTVTINNNNVMIGAMYHTVSGATELDICLNKITGLTIDFADILVGKTSVDWGDGTVDNALSHTYSNYGDYTIKIFGVTSTANSSSSVGGLLKGTYSTPNHSLVGVFFANSLLTLGNYLFRYCVSLKYVVIPNSVTNIGTYLINIEYCIESIVIPNSITNINTYFIGAASNLKTVVIPNSVTKISDNTFIDCVNLIYAVIPDSVTSIGKYAFNGCRNLTSIIIPDSVTSIGESAFSSCYGLTTVTFGDSVTTIGASAFSQCPSLTSVVIPDSVASVGNSAFYYCYSLTSVVIGDNVTTIGDSAFYNCYSLTSVVIPDSVTTINSYAFAYNHGARVYDFSNCTNVPQLPNSNTFTKINAQCKILVPSALYDTWSVSTNWSTYANYMVPV